MEDEGSLGTYSPDWLVTDTVSIPGNLIGQLMGVQRSHLLVFNLGCDEDLAIRVRPALGDKCPRCWMFTRQKDDALCPRCKRIV